MEYNKYPLRVIASFLRKMYWTDFYNSSGRIERADMDGKNREVIINNGLEQPSGLTLDIENEVIYWVDTKSLKVSCILFLCLLN